jgi:FdhE protein
MHGTTTSVKLAEAELDPAWRPWVRLLDIALAAADDAVWTRAVPEPSLDRTSGAPLIHGAVIRVDARRVRALVRELIRDSSPAVRNDDTVRPRRLDALGLLQAAITQDAAAIERVAKRAAVQPGPLGAIGQMAAIPVLRACATAFRDRIPSDWTHGYCPVCAAWPTLVEIRGLERSRRLRCGRCSSDWPISVLRCPFCNETHHDNLHALLPEGDEQTRRVDVCETCKGYIKGISTLQATPLRALAITDLATIELDLVAQERGYERPPTPGFALSLSVVRASAPNKAPAAS